MKTVRQMLYKLWAMKSSDVARLKREGMIQDGSVSTTITPEGLEQTLNFVPTKPIKFIECVVNVSPDGG